ncbi:hypothetical protein [uncultured Paracoccus sp.]|uniref:hypothetical protein n=1 Tax=uncultured Paracoccus sp. TaxID=189685 RepID=UPI002631F723|nr:hypothetical protein [uncultured Paracoccus sp.]
MSVLRSLREALANAQVDVDLSLQGALADAERLADEFAEVRPQSYIVPIEKFVGLPVLGETLVYGNSRTHR